MPTTSNFGWTTPADTDLVKDGAAAIRTLGNGIDTSFLDLKGGTTDQVLAKNSNTDLDFKWVSDATGIQATIFDAKGDLIAASAADTAARLPVGTNGQILSADSSETTGLKWIPAPSSGGMTLLATTTLSGNSTTISGISGSYKDLLLIFRGVGTNGQKLEIRVNGITTSSYYGHIQLLDTGTPTNTFRSAQSSLVSGHDLNNDANNTGHLKIYDYANTGSAIKFMEFRHWDEPSAAFERWYFVNVDQVSAAMSSVTFLSAGTLYGTVLTYGVS